MKFTEIVRYYREGREAFDLCEPPTFSRKLQAFRSEAKELLENICLEEFFDTMHSELDILSFILGGLPLQILAWPQFENTQSVLRLLGVCEVNETAVRKIKSCSLRCSSYILLLLCWRVQQNDTCESAQMNKKIEKQLDGIYTDNQVILIDFDECLVDGHASRHFTDSVLGDLPDDKFTKVSDTDIMSLLNAYEGFSRSKFLGSPKEVMKHCSNV